MAERPIEIVLTGGPCAGKSTALAVLSQKLADWGFRVMLAPEVATMLIGGGITDIGTIAADRERFLVLERHFLAFQRALRERYQALAGAFPGERMVVIYDRGESDVAAYVGKDGFARLLTESGLTLADVRDSYDGVIHLVTAAVGAREFYTTANNTARRETPEEAAALDERTLSAWVGHPHLRVIDNSTDFEAKIDRVLAACARVLGIPEPLEIERKYLLASPPSPEVLAALGAQAIDIEQIYLADPDPERHVRIRRRGVGASAMYYRTEKSRRSATTRVETESVIDRREYERLAELADPARRPIRKTRHCFALGGTYYELDEFKSQPGLWLLEIELGEEDEAVAIPAVLGSVTEVTGDSSYGNRSLARIG